MVPIEIETLAELDRRLERARSSTPSMDGWQLQGLDLRGREDALLTLDPAGAVLLGCTLADEAAERLRVAGALIFPTIPDLPFDPWRAHLYTPAELYAGLEHGYDGTPDARIHAWSRAHGSLRDRMARSVHDRSIDDALDELLLPQRAVGVMGGHATERSDPAYAEAAVLAHGLAGRGLTVATGGGPGAMEAANLGARLAEEDRSVLDRVLADVAQVPSFRPDVGAWVRVALAAVEGLGDSGRSLGIPTWHYGHEPPNPFASSVAKYFRNAIREDVLLQVSRAGIVFLPGAAGTVQEVFQAACTNYYAEAREIVPMVFVGEEHWTCTLPAWPLVSVLAGDRPFAAGIFLVDSTDEVPGLLLEEG